MLTFSYFPQLADRRPDYLTISVAKIWCLVEFVPKICMRLKSRSDQVGP